jgi:hypothetical protein
VEDGDGVRVFYEVFGESPDDVCLLPVWAFGNSRAWRSQIPYLARITAMYPKHTSGALAEATGGRLHVFDGLGPLVGSRWPVAMNIVLRDFFESVRAGDPAAPGEAVA